MNPVKPGASAFQNTRIRPLEMNTGLLFETQTLCKYYRAGSRAEIRAVDEVSMGVPRGSCTVLIGASGSGKTTLLALLGALDRPTRGNILFDGKDLGDCADVELTRVRRRLGFVFQDLALIPKLSVLDNISYALIPHRIGRLERRRRAEDLIARFGIGNKSDAPAAELSGGEQQRVAIARALAGRPEAVLADEPTSHVDPQNAQVLLAAFQELHRAGKTLVLASHDPQIVGLASHVIELEGGRIKGVGPV
jgi:putative ABC transport system ATP-binding protein